MPDIHDHSKPKDRPNIHHTGLSSLLVRSSEKHQGSLTPWGDPAPTIHLRRIRNNPLLFLSDTIGCCQVSPYRLTTKSYSSSFNRPANSQKTGQVIAGRSASVVYRPCSSISSFLLFAVPAISSGGLSPLPLFAVTATTREPCPQLQRLRRLSPRLCEGRLSCTVHCAKFKWLSNSKSNIPGISNR